METTEYKKMAERERDNFWHVGRREILESVLRRRVGRLGELEILDVGCGTGGNMLLLGQFGTCTGIDMSSEALQFATQYGFSRVILGSATDMPLPDASFGLVSALDVLEHIKDDTDAIREVHRVLKADGYFLITVPAFPFLWSRHDEALHHVRRYTMREIRKKILDSGFEIIECNRFVMPGVPARLLRKGVDWLKKNKINDEASSDAMHYSEPLESILLAWLRLEKRAMEYVRIPFGTSIVILAKKPLRF